MRADLRLAWLLTRGSDRREWWRAALTALGAALATGIGLVIAVLVPMDGQYRLSIAETHGANQVLIGPGLLDEPGTRDGVIIALMLLLLPVLGFLGQCARVGAVHRDRRLAALRLAGATPAQVRRIAALESGLACLAGSAVTTVFAVLFLLRVWHHPDALAWAGMAQVAVLVPVAGAVVSALSLRRVVASPLGWIRRTRPTRGPGRVFRVATGLLAVPAVLLAVSTVNGDPFGLPLAGFALGPLTVFGLCLLVGATAVSLAGWSSRRLGTALAARTRNPAVLIAAERLSDDPWAAARTHAAVLLVTVVGTGFVGVRQALIAEVNAVHAHHSAMDVSYYRTGADLAGAAVLVSFLIVLAALAVGTAESLATRRRGLAAQTAAGVPRAVLGRALLLETALPLLPGVAVAGAGGMMIGVWYASLAADRTVVPYPALLVPLAVYGCCLLAAATSLPLLRRSVRPAELRYA
ncbi:FtsX-like permease family protein [Streptomyces panaciradicis]|uniref:FtsX-like permease family protein n=1 Tax=Streptomyces panaciradicis TaxID=1470261 RepID=UPI00201D20DD|nr:FtsX-like permease family protein [Streptomyces panaciradicis]MCL6670566.1 ABC transporter permease [Streptomyces panaciradicis]